MLKAVFLATSMLVAAPALAQDKPATETTQPQQQTPPATQPPATTDDAAPGTHSPRYAALFAMAVIGPPNAAATAAEPPIIKLRRDGLKLDMQTLSCVEFGGGNDAVRR